MMKWHSERLYLFWWAEMHFVQADEQTLFNHSSVFQRVSLKCNQLKKCE